MGFFVRLLVVVLVVAGATLFVQRQTQLYQKQDIDASLIEQDAKTTRVRIGNNVLSVEIADTDTKRAQGLSGRTALAENAGMLFIFDVPGFYNFWMPNMRFPIDIIWIDENRHIIGIVENAPPINPEEAAVQYAPPAPIAYALETQAGFSAEHNIAAGQRVDFE